MGRREEKAMSAPAKPKLTQGQMELLEVARLLSIQEKAQVRLSSVGVIGLGLLTVTAYLIWRKS
jgi:hypothetical protein